MSEKPSGKLSNVEFEMMVDEMIRTLPYTIKYHVELSKLYKSRYDSLIAAGFSDKEALEIVKARGIE
ncbi:hypothetical protein AWM68_19765 [Fictibacillus phosphorivorans]|uniref:Phage protein n=1 Tax=Fictibacillus phosphorivorans TaxID=1221500 RepID=A0A165NPC5_9BACL|nr:hypothetical protein [Fictibacillus phosphorivorans]KZE67030.1 hypothetical protein AWM68_19765 [Fictibacillus phosphorivorans]